MELLFLGTGAGMPSKARNTSALALKLLEERGSWWLFDCGEATQHQILYTSLKPRRLEKIFITHLHGDHIFGLPGLLGSRSFQDGFGPLDVYGPPGLGDWIDATLSLTGTRLSYPLTVHEVEEGTVFEDEAFRVQARMLSHVVPSFGFRIEQKELPGPLLIEKALALGVPKGPLLADLKNGKNVMLTNNQLILSSEVTEKKKKGFSCAILGDTRLCQASVELAQNVDVLIHEGTFGEDVGDLAKPYGHSTMREAMQVAREARVGHLILNHFSSRYSQVDIDSALQRYRETGDRVFAAADFSSYVWREGALYKAGEKEEL